MPKLANLNKPAGYAFSRRIGYIGWSSFHFPIVDFSKAVVMSSSDALRQLLIDSFGLPSDIEPENITQKAIPAWDSLASVQLIAELQGRFNVDFDVEQLESLRSYSGIATALSRKGVTDFRPGSKHAS